MLFEFKLLRLRSNATFSLIPNVTVYLEGNPVTHRPEPEPDWEPELVRRRTRRTSTPDEHRLKEKRKERSKKLDEENALEMSIKLNLEKIGRLEVLP